MRGYIDIVSCRFAIALVIGRDKVLFTTYVNLSETDGLNVRLS